MKLADGWVQEPCPVQGCSVTIHALRQNISESLRAHLLGAHTGIAASDGVLTVVSGATAAVRRAYAAIILVTALLVGVLLGIAAFELLG